MGTDSARSVACTRERKKPYNHSVWGHLPENQKYAQFVDMGSDFESVANKWWISQKRHAILNVCSAAILWSLWKLRNAFCSQGTVCGRMCGWCC